MDSISQIALIDHGIDLERAQIARVAAWSRHWLERKMLNNNKYPTITVPERCDHALLNTFASRRRYACEINVNNKNKINRRAFQKCIYAGPPMTVSHR